MKQTRARTRLRHTHTRARAHTRTHTHTHSPAHHRCDVATLNTSAERGPVVLDLIAIVHQRVEVLPIADNILIALLGRVTWRALLAVVVMPVLHCRDVATRRAVAILPTELLTARLRNGEPRRRIVVRAKLECGGIAKDVLGIKKGILARDL